MAGHFGGNPFDWTSGVANTPHITRYYLARGWIEPGETVLDAACCNGYGTYMLSQFAKKAIGIDCDEGCIKTADGSWKTDKTEFILGDLSTMELPDVDVTISIESLEHVNDMNHFIEQIKKHTKRMFIICVPLGGTSHAYSEEAQKTPAGECNDFANLTYLSELISDNEWHYFIGFQFGYSGMGVFYKHPPEDKRKLAK